MLIHTVEIQKPLQKAGTYPLPCPLDEAQLWQQLKHHYTELSLGGYFQIKQNNNENTMMVGISSTPQPDTPAANIADALAADHATAAIDWDT